MSISRLVTVRNPLFVTSLLTLYRPVSALLFIERRETQPLTAQVLHARRERQGCRVDGGRDGVPPAAAAARGGGSGGGHQRRR